MGGAAVQLADIAVATSDNPRSEPPARILAEIEAGMAARSAHKLDVAELARAERGYAVIEDRREAIDRAVRAAVRGDVLLIAGKGHEKVQIVADRREPFDDCTEARSALQRRAA
jgi:UDP-N-acetylmuramoyl-L-alanyl-D-glutamate--2,6-diaminopimelate ligase